jgi:hypothetical protein
VGWLSPLSLLWLGLLAPLVALYVLKRRRQVREVGSTLLWSLAARDLRAERPWRRLVPQLSLLLQALAIIAGAVALARPVGAGGVAAGARIAVVLDTSASMAARSGATTRLAEALDAARALVRSLPPGGALMLVEAGAEAAVLVPPTHDARALERVLAAVRPRGSRADLGEAVALAAERLRGFDGARIVVLTDAAGQGEFVLDGGRVPVEVRRVGAGGDADNTGIVAVDVRPRPTLDAPDRAEIFVRLARFAERPADLHVSARVEGGGVVASRRITIAKEGVESVVMTADLPPDAAGRGALVHVSLSRPGADPDAGAADALALDDHAVAPGPGARRLPVFLVGAPSPPVERAFRADPDVELFATSLETLAQMDGEAPLDGLVVYTGATPPAAPPGDSLVIAPTGASVFGVPLGPEVARPEIVRWEEGDPRLRFVALGEVRLEAARTVRGGLPALVAADVGAVAAVQERPSGETTILAFDPARSDWPARSSFVVFLRNLVERARARRAAGGIAPGRCGEPLRVPAPEGVTVEVESPDGETLRAVSRGGVALVAVPAVPGVFRVRSGERRSFALRSLVETGESDVRARVRFVATSGGNAVTRVDAARATTHEAWPFAVGALLVLLVLEALWATRRGAS